jgi:uncharacterized RDD family membrane protein YckC
MKCPKCDYLGFDTGERCRNCGYDFSLIAAGAGSAVGTSEADLPLRHPDIDRLQPVAWPDDLDRSLVGPDTPEGMSLHELRAKAQRLDAAPAEDLPLREVSRPPAGPFNRTRRADTEVSSPRPARAGDSALPLFSPASLDDDEPLIKMPAAPRPPLSVRRTPESAARRAPKEPPPVRPIVAVRAEEPTLGFVDDSTHVAAEERVETRRPVRPIDAAPPAASGVLRRGAAVLIDHAILIGIDLAVVYFTLRVVALTWSDWRLLTPLPLLAFLALIKLAYFSAFTALGGQTIGKMATRIRVVSEQNRFVEPMQALGRSFAGVLSLLTLGIGFLPALLTSERRALHDRLAHTRVVSL